MKAGQGAVCQATQSPVHAPGAGTELKGPPRAISIQQTEMCAVGADKDQPNCGEQISCWLFLAFHRLVRTELAGRLPPLPTPS